MKIDRYIIPLIFTFLGFLIYSNVLYGPFIFDDHLYIADNYWIKDISNYLKDFSGARCIGLLTFAINYYFGGLNTFGYHIVNVAIHIINAILVYILIEAMGYRQEAIGKPIGHLDYLPFAVSLIFLVHPIQTQAVSYITQRFASLATLFYLLSLVLYVKARKTGNGEGATGNSNPSPIAYSPVPIAYYILSLFSAILAMKTKEISFTLPFIIALYEFTFFSNTGLKTLSKFFYLLPFFLMLSIIPLTLFLPKDADTLASGASEVNVGEMIRQMQLKDISDTSAYSYFLTQFRVIVTYIRLLFIPVNQAFDYDYALSKSIFEPATFISVIFLLIIFSSAIYLYFRSRITHHAHGLLISFGILWFFITLSVESSIIPIKDVIFEHRLYLPSVGFILSATAALFYGFDYLEKKTGKSLYNYLLSILAVVSVILALSTYKRNVLWGDNYLMQLDNVIKAPNKVEAHNNMGAVYYKKNMLDKAAQEYLAALRLKPYFADAHGNLGLVYAKQGLLDKATQEYVTAIVLKPDDAGAYSYLGSVYFNQGRLDEAITKYIAALKFKPLNPALNYEIGVVYYSKGLMDKALERFLIALELWSDRPEAHYNIGTIYYQKGLVDKAIAYFEAAVKLKPDYVEAYNNLGIAYDNKGWIDKAFESFQTALRLKPDDPESRYNIGLAYLEKGLKYEARKEFETALKLRPDFTEARQALERLYERP